MTEVIVTLDNKLKVIEVTNNTFKGDKDSDLYLVDNGVFNFLTLLEQPDIINELQNRHFGLPPKPITNINLDNYVRIRKQ